MSAATLAKITLPPPDHPLRPYTEQMAHNVNGIYDMLVVLVVALVLLTAAFAAFAYQKWRERQDIRAERADVRKWRGEVVDLTTACAAILAAIKGRALVLEQSEARRSATVEQAATEMKAAVAAVPDQTAQKVVDALGSGGQRPPVGGT